MPGFVDPRPHLEAELSAKRDELAITTDETDRSRLQSEIGDLERQLGHRGILRSVVFGWWHRAIPW